MGINFSHFNIGRRALHAGQLGIAVAGQNIANVNTPGYARQQLQISAAPGGGVTVDGIRSFRDRFVETRLQSETASNARLIARRDALTPVEAAFNESDAGGINSAMSKFFSSWRDLEAQPNSVPSRAVVIELGAALSAAFRSTARRLDESRSSAVSSLKPIVEEVNQLAGRVAELNGKITNADLANANVLELKDQRAEAARNLSELVGARSLENPDGSLSLTLGDGQSLVLGTHHATLAVSENIINGKSEITFTLDGTATVINDGSARGLIDAIAEIDKQASALDALAASLFERVNSLHTSGTDLDGNAGENFFVAPQGGANLTAATLNLNPALRQNPRLVVSSLSLNPNSTNIAGGIADLLNSAPANSNANSQSLSSAFASIVGDVGAIVRATDDALITQGLVLQQVTMQREAVSGVSLDEEAINLLQYQKAYEAAARFIKIADEMTQTIIALGQ